jgi:ABC-type sugar transport system substrate-binding protein
MAARPKIVVALLTDQQEFQLQQAEDARLAAAEAGVDIEVVFAEGNGVLQIHQLFGRINVPREKRPAAIVAESAAGDGLQSVARAAAQAGIGWVLVSSHAPYLDLLQKEYPSLLISSATANDEEIGRIQARQFRTLLPSGGSVFYIEGPATSAPSQLRRKTMDEGLRGSNVKIGKSLHADWTEAGAKRVVSSWLQPKLESGLRPDLIGAQTDTMALGAREALRANRPEWLDIPMTGCDGLPSGGQDLVNRGVLAATVVKPTTAGAGLALVARALRGGPLPSRVILSPQSYPSVESLAARSNKK